MVERRSARLKAAGTASGRVQKRRPTIRIHPRRALGGKPAALGGKPPIAYPTIRKHTVPAVTQNDDTNDDDPTSSITLTWLTGCEHIVPITLNGEDRRMKGVLAVYKDDTKDNRIDYRTNFYLEPADDTSEPVHLGYVEAWRISRPTTYTPNAKSNWINDYLVPNLNTYGDDPVAHEIALCLRALFKKNGEVRAANVVRNLRDEVVNRPILFIQMIHVYPAYQGQGLLRRFLRCLREELLQRVPEWFVFREGVILLTPARPSSEAGDSWGDTADAVVETTLVGIYERTDNYVVCVRNGRVDLYSTTVMGRLME